MPPCQRLVADGPPMLAAAARRLALAGISRGVHRSGFRRSPPRGSTARSQPPPASRSVKGTEGPPGWRWLTRLFVGGAKWHAGAARFRQGHGRRLLDVSQALLQQRGDLASAGERSLGRLVVQLADDPLEPFGTSGLISRIGRGCASLIRRRTPSVVSARNGGRPVAIA